MRTVALVALLALSFLCTACVHPGYFDLDGPLDHSVESDDSSLTVHRDVIVNAEEPTAPTVLPPASPRDRPRPDPVPFRIGAGHGALGSVDLASCRAMGLPSGYLRMKVTFHRDGRVAHAVVEGSQPPPQQALDCIADRLDDASVPAFDGRDASLSRRFFVAANQGDDPSDDTVVRKSGAPRHHENIDQGQPGLARR